MDCCTSVFDVSFGEYPDVPASRQVVANALGLNDSKYQYVIDALEADELRRQREERDEEDRRQVRYKYRNPNDFVSGT